MSDFDDYVFVTFLWIWLGSLLGTFGFFALGTMASNPNSYRRNIYIAAGFLAVVLISMLVLAFLLWRAL